MKSFSYQTMVEPSHMAAAIADAIENDATAHSKGAFRVVDADDKHVTVCVYEGIYPQHATYADIAWEAGAEQTVVEVSCRKPNAGEVTPSGAAAFMAYLTVALVWGVLAWLVCVGVMFFMLDSMTGGAWIASLVAPVVAWVTLSLIHLTARPFAKRRFRKLLDALLG